MTNPSDLTDEAGCRELCEKHGLTLGRLDSWSECDSDDPDPSDPDPEAMSALAEAVRMMREKAIAEIITSTGPTGGWLDSPKAIAAAIRALQLTAKDIKRGEL